MLFYDAAPGGKFSPFDPASRLTSAVALVKAAGLDSAASSAILPATVTDASSIPPGLRGYVAVALQQGYITLINNQFVPARSLTRIELATALNKIINN
jgi:hypothetical protein